MNITLDLFKHKGSHQIGIRFPFDFETKEYIKQFIGVRWTASHACFYVTYTTSTYSNLLLHLQAKNWTVNVSKVADFKKKNDADILFIKKYDTIVNKFGNWMLQQRYSESSITTYTSVIKIFLRHYENKNLDEITEKDIIRFNQDYILANGFSVTFQNQLISALKLFYRKYQNKNLDLANLERPKKYKYLPEVLSIKEVESLLSATSNLKHKILLSIIYSAGLRIGEALSIRLRNIDSERMMIHLMHAKGNKDRYVPLSPKLLILIREYIKLYKPKYYLFEGRFGRKYSQSSARSILKKALQKTSISKRVTLHTLRHSYATHLLESGTDIRYIQELLGHASPKTTMIYTHVSSRKIQNIKSPFDKLNI